MTYLLSYPDPVTQPRAFFTYIANRLLELPLTRFASPYEPAARQRYGNLAQLLIGDSSSHLVAQSPENDAASANGGDSGLQKSLSHSLFHAANRWHVELRVAFTDELLNPDDEKNIHDATTWVRKKLEMELDPTAKAQILNSRQKYRPPNLRRDSDQEEQVPSETEDVKAVVCSPPPTRGPFSPVNGQFHHRARDTVRRQSADFDKKDVYANFKSKRHIKHRAQRSCSYL